MRIFVAETTLIILGLLCSPASLSHAGAPAAGCVIAGPGDPSVDGDLDGMPLRPADPQPAPAASDRARVALGPGERKEPAAPEVRQTPAGGQSGGRPDEAGQDERRE